MMLLYIISSVSFAAFFVHIWHVRPWSELHFHCEISDFLRERFFTWYNRKQQWNKQWRNRCDKSLNTVPALQREKRLPGRGKEKVVKCYTWIWILPFINTNMIDFSLLGGNNKTYLKIAIMLQKYKSLLFNEYERVNIIYGVSKLDFKKIGAGSWHQKTRKKVHMHIYPHLF